MQGDHREHGADQRHIRVNFGRLIRRHGNPVSRAISSLHLSKARGGHRAALRSFKCAQDRPRPRTGALKRYELTGRDTRVRLGGSGGAGCWG